MSEISDVRENIQNGIQNFQLSTAASKEASTKVGEAQQFLRLATGGLQQVIEDIMKAEKLFEEVTGSYGDMASNAKSGTEAFKEAAENAPHESTPSDLIYYAEELTRASETLTGKARRMSSDRLAGLRSVLESENQRLARGVAGWEDKIATTNSYSTLMVPELILQKAEQWRDSF